MYCPKCGTESTDQAAFCHSCGARLPGPASSGQPTEPDRGAASAFQEEPPKAKRQKVYPDGLHPDQYAHPHDRRSLEVISRFAPVVAVTRALIKNWEEPRIKGQLLGGTVKVGPDQFSEIYELVADCAAVLNMELPDVFIRHHPSFNAMTLGAERPLIILHSALVESFSTDELLYIIGHEMGHIRSEHSLYLSAANILTMGARSLVDRLFGLGSLLVVPAMQALQAWMRKAELTADRAGLLCVQDLDVARRALIKLALGSARLFERINIDEYLNQADQAARDGYGRMSEFFQTHPHIANRVRELRFFHESPVYGGLLGAQPAADGVQLEHVAAETLARGRELLSRVSGSVSGMLSYRSNSERALNEFDRVIARFPGSEAARQALYYKGVAHANLRQSVEAAKAFQSFILHNPLHELAPDAIWGLAATLDRALDDREGAVAEYRRLVHEFPESPRATDAEQALHRLGVPSETVDQH